MAIVFSSFVIVVAVMFSFCFELVYHNCSALLWKSTLWNVGALDHNTFKLLLNKRLNQGCFVVSNNAELTKHIEVWQDYLSLYNHYITKVLRSPEIDTTIIILSYIRLPCSFYGGGPHNRDGCG